MALRCTLGSLWFTEETSKASAKEENSNCYYSLDRSQILGQGPVLGLAQ